MNKKEGTFSLTIDPEVETNDKLIVEGTAVLEGGMVKLMVIGLTDADTGPYTILEANAVEGKLDDPIDNLFIDRQLNYTENAVMFSSIRKGDSFSDFAETPNQKEIASQVLDSLLSSDPDHPVVEALLILTTTEQAQAAFDLLTGEAHVSLKGALLDADHHKVAAINSRIHGCLSNAEAQTSTAGFANLSSLADDQSGLWISGYSCGVAALTAPSASNHTIATTLGIRNAIGMEDAIQVRTMVGRRHVFGDTSPAASFRLANRSAGRIQAAPITQDALVTKLGLETNISDIAVLGVVYSGLYGDSTTTHGIRADFKLMF